MYHSLKDYLAKMIALTEQFKENPQPTPYTPPDDDPWVERLMPRSMVWLPVFGKYGLVMDTFDQLENGFGVISMIVDPSHDDEVRRWQPVEKWHVNRFGKGFDGSQILLPTAGFLPDTLPTLTTTALTAAIHESYSAVAHLFILTKQHRKHVKQRLAAFENEVLAKTPDGQLVSINKLTEAVDTLLVKQAAMEQTIKDLQAQLANQDLTAELSLTDGDFDIVRAQPMPPSPPHGFQVDSDASPDTLSEEAFAEAQRLLGIKSSEIELPLLKPLSASAVDLSDYDRQDQQLHEAEHAYYQSLSLVESKSNKEDSTTQRQKKAPAPA